MPGSLRLMYVEPRAHVRWYAFVGAVTAFAGPILWAHILCTPQGQSLSWWSSFVAMPIALVISFALAASDGIMIEPVHQRAAERKFVKCYLIVHLPTCLGVASFFLGRYLML